MCHMATIQNYIEITRQQIISQLQDEIEQFQSKLEMYAVYGKGGHYEESVCGKIIARKQQLIARLS